MTQIPEGSLSGWRVLIIDDEPDAAEVTQLLLEIYGMEVHVAHSGAEGLAMLAKLHPRFIICDISMPEMSGWEVIDQLKMDRSTLEIPVVALTAHAMTGDREKAISRGFHNYLTKPLHPETFVQKLLALLADEIPELRQMLAG